MEKKANKGKYGLIFLIILLTVFLVSFSVSAWIIINANKLVYAEDYDEYLAIMEGLDNGENKDQKIIELTAQVERYKEMYDSLAEENQSLIKANQSLSSNVSRLEGEISKRPSSSGGTTSSEKPDEDKNENSAAGDTEEKNSEKPTDDKTTSNKNTSTTSDNEE